MNGDMIFDTYNDISFLHKILGPLFIYIFLILFISAV